MHLSSEMFYHSVQNSDSETLDLFFDKYNKILQQRFKIDHWANTIVNWTRNDNGTLAADALEKSLNSGYSIASESLQFLVPSNISQDKTWLFECLAQAIRLAGMLHDLGHPPFSHVCEASLVSFYSKLLDLVEKQEELGSYRLLYDSITSLLGGKQIGKVAFHEEIGCLLAEILLRDVCRRSVGSSAKPLAMRFVSSQVALSMLTDEPEFQLLHQIVSGTIDSDRLDYVKRDSLASGHGTDVLQYERLINDMRIVKEPSKEKVDGDSEDSLDGFVFAFPMKAVSTIDSFLKKRFDNYKTIVYHHRVVKSEQLMIAVIDQLSDLIIDLQVRKESDSAESGSRIADDISGLWQPLANLESARGGSNHESPILMFSQWNDAWLMSMLMGIYTKLKTDVAFLSDVESRSLLVKQLAELLFSEPAYQSVVKRYSDCVVFREELYLLVSNKVEQYRENLNLYSPAPAPENSRDSRIQDGSSGSSSSDNEETPASPIWVDLNEFVNSMSPKTNYVHWIKNHYVLCKSIAYKEETYGDVEALFKAMIMNCLKDMHIEGADVLVASNQAKLGVGLAYVYADDLECSAVKLDSVSNVKEVLGAELDNMPAIFCYVYVPERRLKRDELEDLRKRAASEVSVFIDSLFGSLETIFI